MADDLSRKDPKEMAETTKRVRKLRYAMGEDAEYNGPQPIRYFNRGGKNETEGIDNPMSPNFVPLTNRGEMGKARFWAMRAKKSKEKQIAGEFDA